MENKKEIILTGEVLENGTIQQKKKYIIQCLQNLGNIKKLNEGQITQFIEYCISEKLNPLKRDVYAVGMGDNFAIVTDYKVYLRKIMASGLVEIPPTATILNEFVKDENGNIKFNERGEPIKVPLAHVICEFRCKRKDQNEIFTKIFRMSEFNKGQSTWKSMPMFMLEKVALSIGVRTLFPEIVGSLPFTPEEQWNPTVIKAVANDVIENAKEDVKKLIGESLDE